MKQKIKEALKTRWGNQLGIKDEKVFEGVAASVETLITSDEQLTQFVEGAKDILTQHQSYADKVRTELNAKIKGLEGEKAELEAKLNGNQPPKTDPEDKPQGEMAQLIKLMQEQNEQMRKQNEALTARFDAFEAERNAKSAFANAESTFMGNDYVKKYADEATDAWERATEMYEATGKSWTAEQLQEKAMGYFNKAVAKKGVDTSKPFESDGGGKTAPDFSNELELLKKAGVELPGEPTK